MNKLSFIGISLLLCSSFCVAKPAEFHLEISNHLFYPAELTIPANTKIRLIISNNDDTPEEFESYELNREKVIMGNSKTVIFIGPLPAGRYPFFGEFNMSTAQGVIIAE